MPEQNIFKSSFNVGSSIFGSDIQIDKIEEVVHEPEDEVSDSQD